MHCTVSFDNLAAQIGRHISDEFVSIQAANTYGGALPVSPCWNSLCHSARCNSPDWAGQHAVHHVYYGAHGTVYHTLEWTARHVGQHEVLEPTSVVVVADEQGFENSTVSITH